MTSPAAILSLLSERSITLFVRDGKLLAVPSGQLTDELRAAIKECRTELIAELAPGRFLAEVLSVFGGSVVEDETLERWEDHLPATLTRPCFGYYPACRHFTDEQFAALTMAQVAARVGEGCGDCDLFHAAFVLAKRTEKREKTEARERARERANAWALEREHAETEEDEE